MARITEQYLRQQGPVFNAILDGEYDGRLMEDLQHAITIRKKMMFRPGTKVRLVGTQNVEIDGKIGTVVKVGPKRIAVGLGEKDQFGYEQQYNVPVAMLEVVS